MKTVTVMKRKFPTFPDAEFTVKCPVAVTGHVEPSAMSDEQLTRELISRLAGLSSMAINRDHFAIVDCDDWDRINGIMLEITLRVRRTET